MSGNAAVSGAYSIPPSPRVGRLDTQPRVRRELARLYREARRGTVSTADASKLANVLSILSRMIENSDLENRLEELEKALLR
jgi:transcription initiation factor TFIIIB Brf1 subunit/transcription initiation factor TFIIB